MQVTPVNSPSVTGEPDEHQIRSELQRITSSRVFRGSQRCQTFLQYVVGKTLAGDSKSLKERTIAVQVFGREATGDLSDDSIVRVGAREIRKRLAQFYVDEGARDPVRIELPAGSYIPVFHSYLAAAAERGVEALKPEPPVPATRRGHIGKVALLCGIALALCLAGVAWRWTSRPARSSFDLFWQPAFQSKAPLMIAMAHPIVYQPSLRAQKLDDERIGRPNPPLQRAISVSPDLLNGSDFVPVQDQFVGFGDAQAALRLSWLFAQRGIASRMRLASRMDFNDLRGARTILIGAYTNRWTIELTKEMRYRFAYDANGKPCIAQSKTGCRWTLTSKADDGRSPEDYVLIARLPHASTNGFTVVCAGLNGYGTEEAGRIISDPDSLLPILAASPKNWANRNLEIVLHVAVVGDAPAQSELVSAYSW